MKTWLDANPNEGSFLSTTQSVIYTFSPVLSILIVNINDLSPSAFDDVYKAVGLDTLSYAPPNSVTEAANWPTLGSMIDSRTRLVTFLDNSANTAVVPYLIDGTHVPQKPVISISNNAFAEFTNIWESPFDVTTTFDCSVNRSKGDSSTEMYLINHFLDKVFAGQTTPDTAALAQTNGVSGTNSLGAQVDICLATQGRPPNFLLVDVCHRAIFLNHLTCNYPSIMSLVEDLYSRWQRPSTGLITVLLLQLHPLPQTLPSLRRH